MTGTSHGQYPIDTNLTCLECDSTCQTCSGGTSTSCVTCPASSYRIYNTGQCNSTGCIDGQYTPAGTFNCLPCDLSCLTCSDATTCTSCGSAVSGSNLYLYSGACLMTCPDTFYPDSSSKTCLGCDASCHTCSGPSATECLSCNSGSLFSANNSCISSCGDGNYSSNSICTSCPIGCKTCTSATVCTSCQNVNGIPYYLSVSSCLLACPTQTYAVNSSNQCVACDGSCASCYGTATYCLSCSGVLYHAYSTKLCQSSCPSG